MQKWLDSELQCEACGLNLPGTRRSLRAKLAGYSGRQLGHGLDTPKERQDRTGQNKQELKNRQNKQKQTKPYLQKKQLISACGSRAGQRMQEEGKYML